MIKKILMRNLVVCACAGALMIGMPLDLAAKPSSSDHQQIIECPVEFASGKGSVKAFQNVENDSDVIYYLPTRFELAQEKDKDSGLTLPSLSLRLTQRKNMTSRELEEFGDFKCAFNMNLSETVSEKLKKELKGKGGFEVAKPSFQPMPIKSVTAILYTGGGKKIGEVPAAVTGNSDALQLIVAGRLEKQQCNMIQDEPVTVVFQLEYQGKIRPLPFQLSYDNEEVLKLLKTTKNRQALLGLLLAADKKSLDAFDEAFVRSKAVVWNNMSNNPRVAKRSMKWSMGPRRKVTIKNLEQLASTKMVAMTLFDRLSSQITLKLPEKLPEEKMATIENSILQVFSEFVEVQLPEKADAIGKVEVPAMSVSSVDAFWAGAGSFNLSSMTDELRKKLVTNAPPEINTACYFSLPAVGNDPALSLKELTVEMTAMDERNQKIAGPVTAEFDFANDNWKGKDGAPCTMLSMDLKQHYDKDKFRLGEGNFQFITRITQDIQGKDRKIEFKQNQPLSIGDIPVANPLAYCDNLSVDFQYLTFGEDLKEVKVELNLASTKTKIELAATSDTSPLFFNILMNKVLSKNNGEGASREKVDAEIQFVTRNAKINKKVEDLLGESDWLILDDYMWQEP